MPRYIEESEIYKLVEPRGVAKVHCSQIDALPRADVVTEIVRCADCRHLCVINGNKIYAICDKTNYMFLSFGVDTRKHYCSFAERKYT